MTDFNSPIKTTLKNPIKKLAILESFRGIAALLIVAFHATELFNLKFNQPFLWSLFEFGDSGVDFFFVLSGFFLALTGSKYFKYRPSHKTTAKDFLHKRWVRIYPFYWCMSLCVIPVYFLVPAFGKGHETDITVVIKSLLLIPQENSPILSVAWFLSHLVFFYLVFSMVILLPRVGSKIVLAGLSVSALFALADIMSGFELRQSTSILLKFVFSYYNLEFSAGYLLGILFNKKHFGTLTSSCILLIGCLTFLISALLDVYILQTSSNTSGFYYYYEFVAYGLSSVMIIGGAAFLEKSYKLKINRWFLMLGTASFSIYLTHYPILSIFTKAIQIFGGDSLIFHTFFMILACVVAVLMGTIIHFLVEKRCTAIFSNYLTYKRV